MSYTIEQLSQLRESEDKVEFKAATNNFSFAGSGHNDQTERRKCFLGYIVALSNEKGGTLVLGMSDERPHTVVGTNFAIDQVGNLEDEVYERLQIRVHIEELFDSDGFRVLVTYVPSRPLGRIMKFEGVGLMRTGESLRNMSDDETLAILSEQESDFSATICAGLVVNDLDDEALRIMKSRYAEKQNNLAFRNLPDEQALIDLDLIRDGQLTYASLILLSKKEKIKQYLPQCAINLEYRNNPDSGSFDNREIFQDPYFVLIDDLWKIINARNKETKVQIEAYIRDISELNDEIIRESINNAVAHRDYQKNSEIVIKQSSRDFVVQSHGGFPLGVNIENILTTNSTPRNRLLADVLTKTGLVERSGQGVDKIFRHTLSEGKDAPDYDSSDLFQVTLRIPIEVVHPIFALFVRDIEKKLLENEVLGVKDIMVLVKVRKGEILAVNEMDSAQKLEGFGAIKSAVLEERKYVLGKGYTRILRLNEGSDRKKIIDFLTQEINAKMGDIVSLFDNRMTRRQVNNIVYKLVEEGKLSRTGSGKSTTYSIAK